MALTALRHSPSPHGLQGLRLHPSPPTAPFGCRLSPSEGRGRGTCTLIRSYTSAFVATVDLSLSWSGPIRVHPLRREAPTFGYPRPIKVLDLPSFLLRHPERSEGSRRYPGRSASNMKLPCLVRSHPPVSASKEAMPYLLSDSIRAYPWSMTERCLAVIRSYPL